MQDKQQKKKSKNLIMKYQQIWIIQYNIPINRVYPIEYTLQRNQSLVVDRYSPKSQIMYCSNQQHMRIQYLLSYLQWNCLTSDSIMTYYYFIIAKQSYRNLKSNSNDIFIIFAFILGYLFGRCSIL